MIARIGELIAKVPENVKAATPALEAKFNHFPTLTFHDGAAYIAAWHNRDVKKLDLATMMVAVSDNAATNILIDRVGMDSVNAWLASLGLKETRLRRKMLDLAAAKVVEQVPA